MAELYIHMKADTTDVENKYNHWRNRIQHLNTEIQRQSRNWGRAIRGTLTALTMTGSLIRRFVGMTVLALNPVFTAIMDAVMQTFYSLQAIAAAYAAGIVTAGFAVLVEGAAVGLAIWGIAAAMTGQQTMQSKLRGVQSLVDSMGSTLTSYGRVLNTIGGS
jgi:hypothetical protein